MGYGKRAIKLLKDYYEGQFTNINEDMDMNEENGKFFKKLLRIFVNLYT